MPSLITLFGTMTCGIDVTGVAIMEKWKMSHYFFPNSTNTYNRRPTGVVISAL